MDQSVPIQLPRRAWWGVACVTCFLWLLVPAIRFFVDHDEGFYGVAARLVSEGNVPYRDFFFPQTPASAFWWGGWYAMGLRSLVGLRVVGALTGTAILAILGALALRRGGQRSDAAIAMITAGTGVLFTEWIVTVKTHGVTTLLLTATAAWMVCVVAKDTARRRDLVILGVLGGMAACTRILVVPGAMVICLGSLLVAGTLRRRLAHASWTVFGATLPLCVSLVPVLASPESAWFSNWGYHELRGGERSLRGIWGVFQEFAGLSHPVDQNALGLQLGLLLCLASAAMASSWRAGARSVCAAQGLVVVAAVTIACASLLPKPPFLQYFVSIPVLLAVVVAAGGRVDRSYWVPVLLVVSLTLPGWYERAWQGRRGAWDESRYQPAEVDAVSRALCASAGSAAPVASSWPSYLVASDCAVHPAAINQFMWSVSHRLDDDARARYLVAAESDLVDDLRAGNVGAFAVGRFASGPQREAAVMLREQGWIVSWESPAGHVISPPPEPR